MTLLIETYAYANAWRGRHPFEKALFALAMLSLSFAMPASGCVVILLLSASTAVAGARIPWKVYLTLMAAPTFFAALSSLTLLVGLSADATGVHVSFLPQQLRPATLLVLRATAASSGLIFFALTTPVADWLPLLKTLGVPPALRDTVMMLYRFVSVFLGHLATLKKAHGARLGFATSSNTLRTTSLIAANLLGRSLATARRMEMGLAARGCAGEFPLLPLQQKLSRRVMALIVSLWLMLVVWSGLLRNLP